MVRRRPRIPPRHGVGHNSREGEEEGQEHEGLICVLERAAASGGRVGPTPVPVVVLGRKDESREPEVRKNEIKRKVVLPVKADPREGKRWEPEKESKCSDNYLIGQMPIAPKVLQKVTRNTRDNQRASPCHEMASADNGLRQGLGNRNHVC